MNHFILRNSPPSRLLVKLVQFLAGMQQTFQWDDSARIQMPKISPKKALRNLSFELVYFIILFTCADVAGKNSAGSSRA